jgi:hypothetical protein
LLGRVTKTKGGRDGGRRGGWGGTCPGEVQLLDVDIDFESVLGVGEVFDPEDGDLDLSRGVLLQLLPLLLLLLGGGQLLGEVPHLMVESPLLHLLDDPLLHLGGVGHGLVPEDLHEIAQLELRLWSGNEAHEHLVPLLLLALLTGGAADSLALFLRQIELQRLIWAISSDGLHWDGVLHESVTRDTESDKERGQGEGGSLDRLAVQEGEVIEVVDLLLGAGSLACLTKVFRQEGFVPPLHARDNAVVWRRRDLWGGSLRQHGARHILT